MATAGLVPGLVDDAIEEIILRFPPSDPTALVRAAVVSKGWRRLVSNPRFRRRFREFHREAPMLGFLSPHGPFESTTSFCPRYARDGSGVQIQMKRAIDGRHGRVLLSRYSPGSTWRNDREDLVVWDPIRGDVQTLPPLSHWFYNFWTAAFVCAAAGCDHLECAPRRPFRVVFVGTERGLRLVTSVCVYSSEDGAWSEHREVATVPPPMVLHNFNLGPSVLVGNALYFQCAAGILEHDLVTEVSTVIRPPAFFMQDPDELFSASEDHDVVLMTTEDDDLGLAIIQHNSKLVLWTRQACIASGKENTSWAQSRVIEIGTSLPVNGFVYPARLVGFADGIRVILVQIDNLLFTVDIKSSHVKEIGNCLNPSYDLINGYHVVPL